MELSIYSLFKVNIENLVLNKVHLSYKDFHLQPSEIDRMAYWEFELYVKDMIELVEQERQKQKEQEDEYKNSSDYRRAQRAYNNPQQAYKTQAFKTPSYPKMNMPYKL